MAEIMELVESIEQYKKDLLVRLLMHTQKEVSHLEIKGSVLGKNDS